MKERFLLRQRLWIFLTLKLVCRAICIETPTKLSNTFHCTVQKSLTYPSFTQNYIVIHIINFQYNFFIQNCPHRKNASRVTVFCVRNYMKMTSQVLKIVIVQSFSFSPLNKRCVIFSISVCEVDVISVLRNSTECRFVFFKCS